MTSPENQSNPEEEGSSLPALLAGIAIVGVAAYLIFGSDGTDVGGNQADNPEVAAQKAGALGGPGRKRGVEDREVDDAEAAERKPRRNPALGAIPSEMAPPRQPEPIPEFKSTAEEIAFWEKRLNGAKMQLENRETFVARSQRRIDKAESADERNRAETTHKQVVSNRDEVKAKVEALEKKLAELRGE